MIEASVCEQLGDPHNFNRYAFRIDENWIQKPRPLIWEHFLFDPRSGIRQILDSMRCFQFLPHLRVDPEPGFFHTGRVQILKLDQAATSPAKFIPEYGESLGALMALCLWFGMMDLHANNIMMGHVGGKTVIAPDYTPEFLPEII